MFTNICTYISLYIRNTAILVNKKLVCISPHERVNTCDLNLHALQTAQNVRTIPVKMLLICQLSLILKSLLNFKVNFLKIWLCQTSLFMDM